MMYSAAQQIDMDATAEQMGLAFAAEVAGRPSVAELWVSVGSDCVHLWLLANEIDANEERDLYRHVNVLDAQFPDILFQPHVLIPSNYRIPLREVLPKEAKKIFPRAA
jgi:hypothetical protein